LVAHLDVAPDQEEQQLAVRPQLRQVDEPPGAARLDDRDGRVASRRGRSPEVALGGGLLPERFRTDGAHGPSTRSSGSGQTPRAISTAVSDAAAGTGPESGGGPRSRSTTVSADEAADAGAGT